jgi:hypothetical protein
MNFFSIDRLFTLILLLVSGLPLTTFAATLPSLTSKTEVASPSQTEVRQLLAQLAEALTQKNRNPDQIMGFYAADCSFAITIVTTGQSVRLNHQQYYRALKISLQEHQAHSYQQAIENIQISGQRAIVQTTVTESITYASGVAVQGISREVSVLEKRNGKLLITRVVTSTNLEPKQAK